jgi:prepilin-type N-terminal cleavage/methylation domain-containing protein
MRPGAPASQPTERARIDGFTLLELLAVIAIIGILLTITIPGFRKSVYKSHRDEAFQALRGIAVAQTAYFATNSIYGDTFDDIGFVLNGGRRLDARTIEAPVYTYTIRALELNGNARGNYRATATANLDPTDDLLDVIVIENQLTVVEH